MIENIMMLPTVDFVLLLIIVYVGKTLGTLMDQLIIHRCMSEL